MRLGQGDLNYTVVGPGTTPDDPADKSPDLPAARKYLADVAGFKADQVSAMSAAEVLMRCPVRPFTTSCATRRTRPTYLPLPQALPRLVQADARLKAAPKTQAGQLATMLLAATTKVTLAQARIERRLACCGRSKRCACTPPRAAASSPPSSTRSRFSPVPGDPASGKPFEYTLEDGTATLSEPHRRRKVGDNGMRYRVTVRK